MSGRNRGTTLLVLNKNWADLRRSEAAALIAPL